MGMNRIEVIEYLTYEGLDPAEFFSWMNGQNVGLDGCGDIIYYENDIGYWVNCKKTGKRAIVFD